MVVKRELTTPNHVHAGLILISTTHKQTAALINAHECDFGVVNPPLYTMFLKALINAHLG